MTESKSMVDENIDPRLSPARELIAALERGEEDQIQNLLNQIGVQQGQKLFSELGQLTRQIHDALNGFQVDSRLTEITESEIPDAKERLAYVVTMTEQAANRTLNAIEDSMPRLKHLIGRAEELSHTWTRFRNRDMDIDEFRSLSHQLEEFFAVIDQDGGLISRQLSEVVLAQDFQDLTGQIIRRVIDTVQEVESRLVDLLRTVGAGRVQVGQKSFKDNKDTRGYGPVVPNVSDQDVVQDQDEVDDLLSSLGF